ncbi:MAG: dienelactone hydrolase family protein [Gammaproteobacteria bacterium]
MKTEVAAYTHQGTLLEGYLAYDDRSKSRRPGILIAHEWFGIGPHEQKAAERLAEAGYLAFAADLYGSAERPQTAEAAAELATRYRAGDRDQLRGRVAAGLEFLKRHPLCEPSRTAALGFCFGGTAVLELARSGADLCGVVSVHGGLEPSSASRAPKIRARVLALHGADDPYVPEDQVRAFQEEMRTRAVDWQMVYYGGTVHSFTNEGAGSDPAKGAAYNPRSTARAWRAALDFFGELFSEGE